MRWNKAATPGGRMWWVLTMPARTTSAGDFGSLLPTPSASSYGSSNNGCPGDGRGEYRTKGKPSLASMIPTPTVSTARQGARYGDRPGKEGAVLADMMLATPRASDAEKAGPNQANRGPARTPAHVAMLGTPRSSRGYDSEEFAGAHQPNPRKFIYQMVPTPMNRHGRGDALNGGSHSRKRAERDGMLPTPLARDIRSDQASETYMGKKSRALSETSGSLGLTGTVASPVSQRRALLLGLVLWMMGASPDFLLACAIAPSPRSGMRSSTKSRKSSVGQS